jgi:hypothetical protein
MSERRPHTESELVDFVRSIDARAPDSLHSRVESLIAASAPRRSGPRFARSLGAAPRLVSAVGVLAVAAVALAIALSVGGSTPNALSLREASALTLSSATAGPPAENPSHGVLLASVDGVSFPYWEGHFGWRSTGVRSDRVAGRAVTTVFYADGRGHRIGYAIVAGLPAPQAHGGLVAQRKGVAYRELVENGTYVVTWLRDGHLCVVSGRGVARATLLKLASWQAPRASVA